MSLRPDDRKGRGRSSSNAGRDRSRSRSNVRFAEAPEPPSAGSSYGYGAPASAYGSNGTSPSYEVRSPGGSGDQRQAYFPPGYGATSQYGQSATVAMPSMPDGFTMGDYKDLPPHERPGYKGPPPPPGAFPKGDDDLAYGDDNYRPSDRLSRHASQSQAQYKYTPAPIGDSKNPAAAYKYAEAPTKITYTAKPQTGTSQEKLSYMAKPHNQHEIHDFRYSSTPINQFHEQLPRTYAHNSFDQGAHIVDITPGHEQLSRTDSHSHGHRLSVNDGSSGLHAPGGLGAGMHRLSVSGNRPDMSHGAGGNMPPPSPLLESYHGTYQSISPMPFNMRRFDDDDELDLLEPLSPSVSRSSHKSHDKDKKDHHSKGHDRLERDAHAKEKRRVVVYDAAADAKTIASALNHHKPDTDAICDTLPQLSHDQIMELRKEYKKQVKVQGKGVNISKHVKTKLTGNFGKAVYVTTLGRWESEGYWANFWYQTQGSRRELLIESLMGRTNAEIRMIEDEFKDKRYSDSLIKCMEKELKMDKFRTAVLMVLEGRRQDEQDVFPQEYVIKDVDMLYRIMREPKGGESTMLDIIIKRSDAHLREVLRTYERMYGENFARAALKRSNNLVGEVIAHILNGVINKPARDAALLQHAIKDIADKNREDELRYELLISRLVRMHWDKMHMTRVQREYHDRYRIALQDAIEEATKGDLCEFLCELCQK